MNDDKKKRRWIEDNQDFGYLKGWKLWKIWIMNPQIYYTMQNIHSISLLMNAHVDFTDVLMLNKGNKVLFFKSCSWMIYHHAYCCMSQKSLSIMMVPYPMMTLLSLYEPHTPYYLIPLLLLVWSFHWVWPQYSMHTILPKYLLRTSKNVSPGIWFPFKFRSILISILPILDWMIKIS